MKSRSASAQPRSRSDVDRSTVTASSNRLPRLRRCRCCNIWRKRTGHRHSYQWIHGPGVWRNNMLRPVRPPVDDRHLELQRVTHFRTGGTNYELIRGGRWVDWWQGQYGTHKDEPNTWERR